jgi:hypothetical protein
MIALRNEQAPTTGLLLLYPISKDSVPSYPGSKVKLEARPCDDCGEKHLMAPKGEAKRHPLLAAATVLGAALVFPRSLNDDAAYMAANLPDVLGPDPEALEDDTGELELDSEVQG